MRKLLTYCIIVLFFASCTKDQATEDTNVPAKTELNLSYGSDPQQKMDAYLPAGRQTDSTRVIVMIHGGAWSEGDKVDFNQYVTVLQQRLPAYAIFNINYRLATASSNAFPAQENDIKSAVNYIIQKKGDFHVSDKLILLGASSGAHMAMLQAYKNTTPTIKAVIDYFGPADMPALYNQSQTPGAQLGLQILLGGTPTSNPSMYQQSSPVNFVDAQDPPTLIFHGLADNVVPVAQSTALQQKLQTTGVYNEFYTYAGLGHEIWPEPTMTQTFDKAEAFIKLHAQ